MSAQRIGTLLRPVAARRSVILCYHGLGRTGRADDPQNLLVDPQAFRKQVEGLMAAGFSIVTVADLAAAGSRPGLAAISFDDGMEDNHALALPILRDLAVPATVYVTTGLIGQPNPWLAGARMMTEDELRDLAAAGFEIGAHTVTHPDMSQLSYDDCMREMRESRGVLEQLTGQRVRTFAYPFCLYGPAALAAARDSGFDAAVTCHNRGGAGPHERARSMVTGKDGTIAFVLKVAGLWDPLFHSAPGRAARAISRPVRATLTAAGRSRR
jgi:peptidoglycan/xylan/chitin deacetylase (PgdA/CDA1 family)